MANTTTTPTDTATETTDDATTAPDGGPDGTVYAALSERPDGATVAALCDSTGLARPAVSRSLKRLADTGQATRTPGQSTGKGRAADVWALTRPHTPDATADTDAPATDADERTEAETAKAKAGVSQEALDQAVRILSEESDRRTAAQAELDRVRRDEAERRARVDAELAAVQSRETTREMLTDLLGVVMTTLGAVTSDDPDRDGVERGLAEIVAYASGLRRAMRPGARPALGGTSTATVRISGGGGVRKAPEPLRPLVVAHLANHPDKEFTPNEIARVLDRSSGAVGNAMDTLTREGQAVMTTEKPRRYKHNTEAAPETAGAAGDATDTA